MNAPEAHEPSLSGRSATAQFELLRDPARSRMVDNFVSDLLQLLGRERWADAYQHASLVPMIAVTLSDKALQFSPERYSDWCRLWVGLGSDAGIDELCAKAVATGGLQDDVPMTALLWLRLRRHLRSVSNGPPYALNAQSASADEPSVGPMCMALASAMRTWYLKAGRRDPVVQQNLSRLMVHR